MRVAELEAVIPFVSAQPEVEESSIGGQLQPLAVHLAQQEQLDRDLVRQVFRILPFILPVPVKLAALAALRPFDLEGAQGALIVLGLGLRQLNQLAEDRLAGRDLLAELLAFGAQAVSRDWRALRTQLGQRKLVAEVSKGP